MIDRAKFEKIIEGLKNPRTYHRGKAIEALMSIKDPAAIPVMFKMLGKEPDFVKIQFCRFLGKIKGIEAVPPLVIFLIEKSEKVAQEAAYALDKIDNDRKTESLMMLLRKGNLFSKKYAIKALGEGRKIKAVPHLITLLKSSDSELKELTIDALRQIGDPSAIKPLTKLLKDKDPRVVYLVLFVLGELGDHGVGPEIVKFLNHKNEQVRKAAVWALGKLDYRKAIPNLIVMLQDDKSEVVREEIASRFGTMAGEDVVMPLVYAKAFDKSPNVKIYANWAMAEIPLSDKEGILLKLASQKDEVIRGEAYLELGKTGHKRFFNVLKKAFEKDKSEHVRASVVKGLGFMYEPEAKSILLTALRDTKKVSESAADALLYAATASDSDLASGMAQGIPVDNPHVREAGIKMIEKIYAEGTAPKEVLATLYNLLPVETPEAKKMIVSCLGKVGDSSTIEFFKEVLTGTDKDILKDEISEAIELLKEDKKS